MTESKASNYRYPAASGKKRQLLKHGEHKSLTTDRIVLVLGPKKQVELVREMFTLALSGCGCTDIARRLNQQGRLKDNGGSWCHVDISNMLRNPKYCGCNVWYRNTEPMRSKQSKVDPQYWVKKEGAFPAIVSREIFDKVQAKLPRRVDSYWSDAEIVKKLRRLHSG